MGREYPDAPLVGVAGVIICGDKVLLIRRKQEPLKGEWSLPGGVLELGETMRAGVVREVFEETGLVVRALAVVDVLDAIHLEQGREAEPHSGANSGRVKYHYVLVDFFCEVVGGVMQAATDAHEARWVGGEQAKSDGEYQLTPATVLVIEKAFQLAQSSSTS